jgi:preprotein translocase subunit SecF
MLQLLIGTNIALMKHRRWAYLFSGTLILATASGWSCTAAPGYSVDFTGGSLVQITANQPLPVDQLREALDRAGMSGAEIQQLAERGQRVPDPAQGTSPRATCSRRSEDAIIAAFPGCRSTSSEPRGDGRSESREGAAQQGVWAILGASPDPRSTWAFRYEFKYAFGAVGRLFPRRVHHARRPLLPRTARSR